MPERSIRLAPLVTGLAALGAALAAFVAAQGDADVRWLAPIVLFDVGVGVVLATVARLGDHEDDDDVPAPSRQTVASSHSSKVGPVRMAPGPGRSAPLA